MQDKWYSDNRDLVKWAVLAQLAIIFECKYILQIAYHRKCSYPQLEIDGTSYNIPKTVLTHFRNIRKIIDMPANFKIKVFDAPFHDRIQYQRAVIDYITGFGTDKCIIFLDPDTGLEPKCHNLNHVLEKEVAQIWDKMKSGDVLVFYQHQTNRAGKSWIEPKRDQLAQALDLNPPEVKIASCMQIARDVVFYFSVKI